MYAAAARLLKSPNFLFRNAVDLSIIICLIYLVSQEFELLRKVNAAAAAAPEQP